MSSFGFSILDEFLPSFDLFNSIERQRLMFLRLYNLKVSCKEKFSRNELKYVKKEPIFNIFKEKIFSLLPKEFDTNSKLINIDIEKTNIINAFIKNARTNISYIKKQPRTNIKLAVKIIKNFEGEDFKYVLNGEDVFQKFVSKRIKDFKADRKVKVLKDEITIYPKGSSSTKVYPYWQFLDKDNLEGISSHVKRAVECIKNNESNQVYLVYPKHKNFDKHINIRVEELEACSEYSIKLIPYSLRSILK